MGLAIRFTICFLTLVSALGKDSGNEAAMKPRTVREPGFTVLGIAGRTSNAKEMSSQGIISKQWERLMKEAVLNKIPNRVDSAIVAVYTDYASDKDGEYTYVVGAKVSSEDHVPPGMVAKTVPAGSYAVFTSEKGPVGKVVFETWNKIWSVPKSSPGGDRAYGADFEVYDERAADPNSAQVDVYVGIK
jgi:predicted transcriptional regulator YdeE